MFALLLVSLSAVSLLFTSVVVDSYTVSMDSFASGESGVRVIGDAGSATGNTVSHVGDYNNDGFNDFVISGYIMTVNGVSRSGLSLIILGGSNAWTEIDMSTAVSGSTVRRIYASVADDYTGSSVGAAGDVNGDGFADVLIAASGLDYNGIANSGAVFVIYGSEGPYSDVVLSSSFVAGPTVGYAIYGFISQGTVAYLVSNSRGLLDDVNGDGIDDFLVAASLYAFASRSGAGCVYIFYGSTSTPVNVELNNLGSAGAVLGGAVANIAFGSSIARAGDFNDDGIVDILVGAPSFTPPGRNSAGIAYLIYGTRTMGDQDMANFVTGATGVRFLGAASNDNAGGYVCGAGDINGDGFGDIVISASRSGGFMQWYGKAYVVFGTATVFTADVDLLTFSAGTMGYRILGSVVGQYAGFVAASAGDIDQVGIDDIVVASLLSAGQISIIYGSTTTPTADVTVATATDIYTFQFPSLAFSTVYFGSVDGGYDVNNDTIPDLLIGTPTLNVVPAGGGATRSQAGAAYMLLGPFSIPSPSSAPSAQPSSGPTGQPSSRPSAQPSCVPTRQPSSTPSAQPTSAPTTQPSDKPSTAPTTSPSAQPSAQPVALPSAQPTSVPSSGPSAQPSAQPTSGPSSQPSSKPSGEPTAQPSGMPTVQPSSQPSAAPSRSAAPTPTNSEAPTTEAVIDTDGSSPTLSDGGIAGVVVGGVVFLILLVIAVAMMARYCAASSASAPAASPQYEMTQVQEA